MTTEREFLDKIEAEAGRLVQAVANARFWHDRALQDADQTFERKKQEIEARCEEALAAARQDYDATVTSAEAAITGLTAGAGYSAAPWDSPAWDAFTPPANGDAPSVTRFGQLTVPGKYHTLTAPALLPIVGGRNLLIKATGAPKAAAVQAIQSVMLRLLATIPAGKLRFVLVDPVGLGANVAGFMKLDDFDDGLTTGKKAWTETHHVEQRMADLTEHMETVIQKYLRNQFPAIEDYNRQAGEIAEPYRLLVVFDFPANFTEAAARRLISVAQNGPRCGVYTLVLFDTALPLPSGFNSADLERACHLVTLWKGERYVWQDDDFRECLLEPDRLPAPGPFQALIEKIGPAVIRSSRVEVPFDRVVPPPAVWWTGSSLDGVQAPLGPAGAYKLQNLELGAGTLQHALVAGKTGSGKSNLLHTLITNLALIYPPEELELYLVDFKKGVEFKTYAANALPNARVIAIESEREFGLSVLVGLDVELKRRGDLFREARVDHIADYRKATGRPLPRVLLLVDEFQEFFTDDDPVAGQSAQVLDRLVRQGRAFGIHVLLGSQTLAGAYTLARSTVDQMAVRIALQCSEADSRLILGEDNTAARRLSRPGEAIYNDANGVVEGNHPFQVALLPDDVRDGYLAQVRRRADAAGYRPPQPQIVFEGNAPADVTQNQLLESLLDAPACPAAPKRAAAWLGEPIAIREATAAHFRRQSASNLVAVGQNDEAMAGMCATALVSLAAQYAPGAARLYLLDFGAADQPGADAFARLCETLPHGLRRGRRRELPAIMDELAAEVARRAELDEAALAAEPELFLCIYGLQRARDLRQEEGFGFTGGFDEEATTPRSPAQQLATILREGPDLGLHTLAWCDTYVNLSRTLDRRALREFEMRVGFQMSAEDSTNLIDTPLASKLGPYRALYYSEEEGCLEKFRPYGVPPAAWLKSAGDRLSKRGGA